MIWGVLLPIDGAKNTYNSDRYVWLSSTYYIGTDMYFIYWCLSYIQYVASMPVLCQQVEKTFKWILDLVYIFCECYLNSVTLFDLSAFPRVSTLPYIRTYYKLNRCIVLRPTLIFKRRKQCEICPKNKYTHVSKLTQRSVDIRVVRMFSKIMQYFGAVTHKHN